MEIICACLGRFLFEVIQLLIAQGFWIYLLRLDFPDVDRRSQRFVLLLGDHSILNNIRCHLLLFHYSLQSLFDEVNGRLVVNIGVSLPGIVTQERPHREP